MAGPTMAGPTEKYWPKFTLLLRGFLSAPSAALASQRESPLHHLEAPSEYSEWALPRAARYSHDRDRCDPVYGTELTLLRPPRLGCDEQSRSSPTESSGRARSVSKRAKKFHIEVGERPTASHRHAFLATRVLRSLASESVWVRRNRYLYRIQPGASGTGWKAW